MRNAHPIAIPHGKLATQDDDAAARRRKELREKLMRGETVKVTQDGTLKSQQDAPNQPGITVPRGKLARFHWYERDADLLTAEREAMGRFFPRFQLDKLPDGRLYWYGPMNTDLRPDGQWFLQAIYDNNHPHNNAYGGSVKVYVVEPELSEIQRQLGEPIPHLLRDSARNIYLCTARKEDVESGRSVTSAASSLAWASKWIAAFELWMAGDLSTREFAGHRI